MTRSVSSPAPMLKVDMVAHICNWKERNRRSILGSSLVTWSTGISELWVQWETLPQKLKVVSHLGRLPLLTAGFHKNSYVSIDTSTRGSPTRLNNTHTNISKHKVGVNIHPWMLSLEQNLEHIRIPEGLRYATKCFTLLQRQTLPQFLARQLSATNF